MKTTDLSGRKSEKLEKNKLTEREFGNLNENLNEERIVYTKPKHKNFYYDNSSISMSYGQYNVEKCLVVLLILLVYSSFLIYNYSLMVNTLNCILLFSGVGLDLIISVLYLYFLIKLKGDEMFNTVPMSLINSSDVLVVIDLVIKVATMIMIAVDYSVIGNLATGLFIFKFLIEFYFAVISIKLLIFCPCTNYIQEQTEKVWNWVKSHIFCLEVDEHESLDYTKMEDLESFY